MSQLQRFRPQKLPQVLRFVWSVLILLCLLTFRYIVASSNAPSASQCHVQETAVWCKSFMKIIAYFTVQENSLRVNTRKRLKRTLLIGQNKTKCANVFGNPLFQSCAQHRIKQFTYLLPVGFWRKEAITLFFLRKELYSLTIKSIQALNLAHQKECITLWCS